MIKTLARRYWFVLLLFLLLLGVGIVLPGRQKIPRQPAVIPPSPVILKQAHVIDQGVQIEWLESQFGTYPLNGYVIERSRDSGDFKRVARVEKLFLSYLDAEGKTGDIYRVIAEDTRNSAGRSTVSNRVVADTAKPGSGMVRAPSFKNILGTSTSASRGDRAEIKATAAQVQLAQAFHAFDDALKTKNMTAAKNLLITMQIYQRQILSLFPQLSSAQKTSFAHTCATELAVFETNLYLLPEQDQLDGLLVLAGCNALQSGEQ